LFSFYLGVMEKSAMKRAWSSFLPVGCLASIFVSAAKASEIPLVDPAAASVIPQCKASSAQVEVSSSADPAGLAISVAPGAESWPGVNLKPADGTVWNLSDTGRVEAMVTNTGDNRVMVAVRVENAGDWHDGPWDVEQTEINPGKSAKIIVYYGLSYGHNPGYALKPAEVNNVLIFFGKSDAQQSVVLTSLKGEGNPGDKPPVSPDAVRTAPPDGVIYAPGSALDKKQVKAYQSTVTMDDAGIHAKFTGDKSSVTLQPPEGRWDLRADLQVVVKVKNEGDAAASPNVTVLSNGGPSDTVSSSAPISPGAEGEITVSFPHVFTMPTAEPPHMAPAPHYLTSNEVSGVQISGDSGQALLIESVTAGMPPTPDLPDWLGERPPVDGAWTKTFDDEFDGNSIDEKKWNVTGANYYDSRTHWTKSELLVGDGVCKIQYEKKRGSQNDDPKGKVTDYATGFLDTYGKWVQRYGYFECRMKLPKAPGLWPAFWMMPDRGVAAGPQWIRSDTAKGGMEFDIMEYLSGWGPNRYNIAMHWDGYGKLHKANGSDKNYVQPDKDGYITCGLLWLPGEAVYYCNGKELLKWDSPRISTIPSYMMFTQPSGGWDNLPLDDKQLPDGLVVDYVRVWQRSDLAEPTDGLQSPAPDAGK
jgi:beta-glucanase (GH16 family)